MNPLWAWLGTLIILFPWGLVALAVLWWLR